MAITLKSRISRWKERQIFLLSKTDKSIDYSAFDKIGVLSQMLCKKCKKFKSILLFDVRSVVDGKIYLHKMCVDCCSARLKRVAKSKHKGFAENKLRARERMLFSKYEMLNDDYDSLLKQQKGKCAICKTKAKALTRNLAVDHCHVKGHVRGLLCSKCNLMIGYACDDVKILKKAIRYIEKHQTNEE